MKSPFPFRKHCRIGRQADAASCAGASRKAVAVALALLVFASPPRVEASGIWSSINLLQDHQFAAIASPEFWFELEMKELAREFPVKEKHVDRLTTAAAELASFDAAVKAGKVDAPDVAALRKQLEETRSLLTPPEPKPEEGAPEEPNADTPGKKSEALPPPDTSAQPAPPETPLPKEEFALYQRGAQAYAAQNFASARTAWKALLALPAEQRHFRSVWAAYMLGRTEIAAAESGKEAGMKPDETAPAHFAQTRELAAAGFDDPLGLASASYGWEARAWIGVDPKTARPEKALELYLKQLSSGCDQAFTSIRFLVRDTLFPEMNLNADPDQTTPPTAEAWENAAKSPLLRRVVTRWYLAMSADINNRWVGEYGGERDQGPKRWLELLEKSQPKAEDADRLGWLAYREGAYDLAKRWLKLAPDETRLSLWLTAKLSLRAGDTAAAAAAMDRAERMFGAPERLVISQGIPATPLPKSAARADHAVILLGQAKFPEALEAFLEAGHWQDAAYVAERVLTLDELKAWVDRHYPKPPIREQSGIDRKLLGRVVTIPEGEKVAEPPVDDPREDAEMDSDLHTLLGDAIIEGRATIDSEKIQDAIAWRLRWLLARRMVREDQEMAARPYFPRNIQPALDAYVAALGKAADKTASKKDQAKSWWTAAWLARHAGMELMGTELEPDGAWENGVFPSNSVLATRRTGMEADLNAAEEDGGDATRMPKLTLKAKFGVPPSVEEKQRLAKHALPKEYRFHYRWVAAVLAKKAAALLADGTEEKADVLNQAGTWMFARDRKAEEAFFVAIKKTCPNTEIGRQVLKKRHTTPLSGPWSGKIPEGDEQ